LLEEREREKEKENDILCIEWNWEITSIYIYSRK